MLVVHASPVTTLKLCGGTLVVEDAERLLADYLDPTFGHAWPAYDTLVTNGSVELVAGDLLAPTLLGSTVDATRYAVLAELMPALSKVADLPPVSLQDADDAAIDAVAALFTVLDDERLRRRGVRGTVISKVLHRKRPDLVPLYDSRVYAAYTAARSVPREAHHSWQEFMGLLCRQMREDLRLEDRAFAELEQRAGERGADLTRLRLLDIVVWMALEDA